MAVGWETQHICPDDDLQVGVEDPAMSQSCVQDCVEGREDAVV